MTEEKKIRTAIQKARLPGLVKDILLKLDSDSSGDPAVWIWVIVSDEAPNSSTFSATTITIRERIRSALQKARIERWPYMRFRTTSEQRELNAEAA